MIIEREDYKYLINNSVNNELCVIIVTKEDMKIVDMASVKPVVMDDLTKSVTFDVVCVFNKARDIFEKNNVLVEAMHEIAKQITDATEGEKDEDLQEDN